MKTPEDVKKALACCAKASLEECDHCPYGNDCDIFEACNLYRDALAYITQLEACVPKWISVEERLPEFNVDVLVYAVGKDDKKVITITSYTNSMYGLGITGWIAPWQYFSYNYKITHWMPIPDAPPEKG